MYEEKFDSNASIESSTIHTSASGAIEESRKYAELQAIMTNFCTDAQPILAYYPPLDGDESSEELYSEHDFASIQTRDFRTRIFFSNLEIEGNNAWIRTHHTDCAVREHIDYVREYFEAAAVAQNHISAKAALTGILDCIFNMDDREYYNFATIMASGLSLNATCTSFEAKSSQNYRQLGQEFAQIDIRGEGMTNSQRENMSMERKRLLLLMDIIFSQISTKQFMDNNKNIFRLVHAEIKGNKNKTSLVYCLFSFFLQSCLAGFVVAQTLALNRQGVKTQDDLRWGLYLLATLGSVFGLASAAPDMTNWRTIYKLFGNQIGLIYLIDVAVNIIIPILLVGVGWYLVTLQADYINGVIMTTALLFIPQIDDQLPDLLGFEADAITENFIIYEAKLAYNRYLELTDDNVNQIFSGGKAKTNRKNKLNTSITRTDIENQSLSSTHTVVDQDFGIDFSDFFLTNSVKEGSDSHEFIQPFNVRWQENGHHELDPSNYITADCLIKQIDFRYIDSRYTKPSIGYLRLTKMDGRIVEIDFASQGVSMERGRVHTLIGCYVITNFVMTSTEIESLRVVGSKDCETFAKGVEYYTVWGLTGDATRSLKRYNYLFERK